ncbi:MAG: outer membrane beta-barrel protein [Bacteroidetes bacterium]|nr:outer membrane beta-barrel protein [Bacteroidota bacterium]
MKRTILILTLICGMTSAYAQAPSGFQLGGGLRISIPTGDFNKTHSFGLGPELQAEYGFSDNVSGVITTGYSSFWGKSVTSIGGTSVKYKAEGYFPLLAGARVYAQGGFFAGAQLGLGVYTYNGNSNSGFNWQPQVGYNADGYQLLLNYNGLTSKGNNMSHIALSAIYKFKSAVKGKKK